jgi:hypothetical protein
MKRKHLWGLVVEGELLPDTFVTKKDAKEDLRIHKSLDIYGPNSKVLKLVIVNERKKRRAQKRKPINKSKKRRSVKKRARKV